MLLNWAVPGKIQTGGVEDILFWKRPLEFLDLSLYSWKFKTKWSFTPTGISKAKNQDPWKFHTIFFLIMPGNSTSFFIDSWSFRFYFFNPPGNVLNPLLPPLLFSGIALEVVTASQTKIWKLLIQQSTRFGQRVFKPYCLTFVLVLCQPWQPCNNESANNRLKLVSAIFTKW